MANPHAHGHHDDQIPERTLPQGTQEGGIPNTHEARDIDLPGVIKWFTGLAAVTALIFAMMYGCFQIVFAAEKKTPAGPPLFMTQQVPPGPPLLPNPQDTEANPGENIGHSGQPLRDPVQYRLDVEREETPRLDQLDLRDAKTGLPKLPAAAAAAVAASNGAGARPVPDLMPSDSSGGTRFEERLR